MFDNIIPQIKNHLNLNTALLLVVVVVVIALVPSITYASFWASLGDATLGNIARFVMWIFFALTGFFMTAAAFLLDLSITKALDSSLITNLTSINLAWGVLRDLANMFFIFILLYIAIATILQVGGVQWKQALARVIIVALLINFSLFFTKVVIDASNMLAVGFYNGLQTTVRVPDANGVMQNRQVYGPSTMVMGGLKLQTLFSADAWSRAGLTNMNIAILYFFGSIFQAVTGFVFLTGAIIFIRRLVAFIFLMILSPIAFVGWILPATQQYSNKWWHSLLQNAFVAPAFLAIIFVVGQILSSGDIFRISGAQNDKFLDTIVSMGASGGYEILFNFIVVIGLMWGSLIVAESISAGATKSAMGIAKKVTGAAVSGGAVASATALRYTAGAASKRASESEWLREKARKGGGFAKLSLGATDKLGSSSMDIRNTTIGRGVTGGLSRLGVNATDGQKVGEGGFRNNIVHKGFEAKRKESERVSNLMATNAHTGEAATIDIDKRDKDGNVMRDSHTGETVKETISVRESEARKYAKLAEDRKGGFLGSPASRTDYDKMAKSMQRGDAEGRKFAKEASDQKRYDEVAAIEVQINKHIEDGTGTPADFKKLVSDAKGDITNFKEETLSNKHVAAALGEKQVASVKRDKKFSDSVTDSVRQHNTDQDVINYLNGATVATEANRQATEDLVEALQKMTSVPTPPAPPIPHVAPPTNVPSPSTTNNSPSAVEKVRRNPQTLD